MSSRETHSRSRSTTAGGAIRTETTNPALLALLRENSSTKHQSPAPGTSAAPAPTTPTASNPPPPRPQPAPRTPAGDANPSASGNRENDPEDHQRPAQRSRGSPRTHTADHTQPQPVSNEPSQPIPFPRSVSQTVVREEEHGGRDGSGKPSQAASPISRTVASDSDSVSSELGRLVGSPSRKSFVISEGDDYGEEADDEEGDATPVASPETDTDRTDARHGAGAHQRDPDSGRNSAAAPHLPPAPAAVPAGGRGGQPSDPAVVLSRPASLRGPAVPSPDLTNPDHQRFVTPYASRRLKDKSVGRSSAVSAALGEEPGQQRASLNVPKDQSWSATQAARLRAGGGRASGEPEEDAPPDSPGTPTPRNSDSEENINLIDSLEFPTDRSSKPDQAAADQAGGVPPGDQQHSASNRPTPQPRAGPARASFSEDSLEAAQAAPEIRPDSLEPRRSPEPVQPEAQPSGRLSDSQQRHGRSSEPPVRVGASPTEETPRQPDRASNPNSARTTPASILKKPKEQDRATAEPPVSRVYVESPSFTREEEDEYRFVSSRVDHHDDADELEDEPTHATYRGLDELAVSRMDGGVAVGARAPRKPFKQVRYEDDEDRYEDRQELLGFGEYEPQQQRPRQEPPQRQYVIKAKNGSAQAVRNPPPQQQPVRSLTLPSGPSYDPVDEEELARETAYQEHLRNRVSSLQRTAEDTVVPRLPLYGESEDFTRDSLDIPEDVELDSDRLARHRNSVDVYEQQQRQHQAPNSDQQWADPPGPPGGMPQRGHFPPQRQGYGNAVRQGYAQPQQGYADNPRMQDYEDPYGQGYSNAPRRGYADVPGEGYGNNAQGGNDDPRRQGYGDPQRQGYGDPQRQGYGEPEQQGYGDPQRQGYGDPRQQGYGDPQRQGYADPQRQGYADPQQQGYGNPQRQGYGDPQRQGYGDPQRQGYADPQRQGYADPQRQGYAEPTQQGYGDPQRQGYADPQQQGYGDPQRQGYADPQRQGYADPQRQGYADPQQQRYVDPQRQTYANPPGGYADVMRQDYDDQQYGQPPVRGQDPRYAQQAPPPQGGQYANPDPRFQGQRQGNYLDRNGPPPPQQQRYVTSNAEPQDGYYMTENRDYEEEPLSSYRDGYYENYENGENRTLYVENAADSEVLDSDRYEERKQSQKPTGRLSSEADHDYITDNKKSYGRPEQRTYRRIHEVKKEEEEKLGHVFIQPKVKGKGLKGSRNSSPSRHHPPPPIAENPADEAGPQGAQDLWAKRSASLARAKNSKQGGKKKSGSNSSLAGRNAQRMYQSDSSLVNVEQPHPPVRQPLQPANNVQMVPVAQQQGQISPSHSPFRHAVDFKPISQQLVTEDGQRISVDVNLRLISPPLGSEPPNGGGFVNKPVGGQRLLGLQYPLENGPAVQQQPYGTPDENDIPAGRYSADDILGGQRGTGNVGYVSDSNHDYGDAVYSTNPYKKIPPIPSNSEVPRSAPVASEGSYMMSYIKDKEKAEKGPKPWYKVYGLKDYKRMQNEVRLGSRALGPDLDNEAFKERREKFMRQMDYAKGVKEKNSREMTHKKPPAHPKTTHEDDMLSKRRLAVEYAKHVPKPAVKPRPNPSNSYELASKLSPIAKPNRTQPSPQHDGSVDVLDLEKLHERHQQDKQSADLIRQKAQGVMS